MTDTLGPLPEGKALWGLTPPFKERIFSEAEMEAERRRCYELGKAHAATEVAKAVQRERERAAKLWRLLDDIDTLDDACRFDDHAFRERTRVVQRRRFDVMTGEEFEAAIRGT